MIILLNLRNNYTQTRPTGGNSQAQKISINKCKKNYHKTWFSCQKIAKYMITVGRGALQVRKDFKI